MKKSWSSISANFPKGKDCLASYVAWQAAEVLMGVKPANLVNITGRTLPCGRNLSDLWHKHRHDVLSRAMLKSFELASGENSRLVLFYDPGKLAETLRNAVVNTTLQSIGYSYSTPEEALAQLGGRIRGEGFPHEIGFFLGYPPKDVLGFMGILKIPCTFSGPWKIYGEKQESIRIVQMYRTAKTRVVRFLDAGGPPLMLLRESPSSAT